MLPALFRPLALASFCLAVACANAAEQAPTFKVLAHFPIGGEGGYDYLRVDANSRRLYVSHSDRVEVLDADTGQKLGQIQPTPGVHGIAVAAGTDRAFISDGKSNSVTVFEPSSLKVITVIGEVGQKPDSIQYDPKSGLIYVANGRSSDIAIIDPAKAQVVGRITLDGKLEDIAFDGQGRLFVNTENLGKIQVVDLSSLKRTASWPVAPGEGGTGLAIDQVHHRLFSAGSNGKLAILDTDTGTVVATPPVGNDPDGAAFDPERSLIYVSNVDGTLTVIHEDSPDAYSVVETVTTAYGARTISFDSKTGHVYLVTGTFGLAPAPTPDKPSPRRPLLPGTLEVLVVGRP